jgi:tripartite-type tricarboxylate transporter receptor subunit TctC
MICRLACAATVRRIAAGGWFFVNIAQRPHSFSVCGRRIVEPFDGIEYMISAVKAAVFIAVTLLSAASVPCSAQGYPAKPVRFVSPYPPGGPNDLIARVIAQRMTQALAQTWFVENRPGRGGNIGVELVAKAAPDGYTLVHGGMGSLTLAPFLSKLPYDALRDFAPVTLTARVPNAIAVHPALPVKSVPELIALARARPGQLDYGTTGVGSTPHLAAALFLTRAQIKMVHIPYKGSAPATIDLVAGQIPILFSPLSPLLPHVEAGKVRALGVSSLQRSPLLPAVPTVSESGVPGFEMNPWFSILAPAGTPREIVARLNSEVTRYLRTPEAAKQFAVHGADAAFSSADELLALIKADLALWGKVIRDNNIQGE